MSAGAEDAPGPDQAEGANGPITNADELLFRQVHPNLYHGGAVASSAFLPTEDDQGQMSVDRSSRTTPKASFDLYRESGRASAAVYGVTVGELNAEGISCHPDPRPATHTSKANAAHAYADFTDIGTNQRKRKAQRLRTSAVSRGQLYRQLESAARQSR